MITKYREIKLTTDINFSKMIDRECNRESSNLGQLIFKTNYFIQQSHLNPGINTKKQKNNYFIKRKWTLKYILEEKEVQFKY